MLPLVSTTSPRLTGTRSLLKWVIGLLLTVLEEPEVFFAQAGHETAVDVGHRGRDVDELDAGFEAEDLGVLCFLTRWRHDDQLLTSAAAIDRQVAIHDVHDAPRAERNARRWSAGHGRCRSSIDVADHVAIFAAEPDAVARDGSVDWHADDEPGLVARAEHREVERRAPARQERAVGAEESAVAEIFESTAPSRGFWTSPGDGQRAAVLRLLERQKLEEGWRLLAARRFRWWRRSRPLCVGRGVVPIASARPDRRR